MKTEEIKALIRRAEEARKAAYAPYSRFPVGAAVLAADGRIFTGCNVENISYPASFCAEQNAVGSAAAAGVREIIAAAVCGSADSYTTPCGLCRQVLATPCGLCRQVLAEFHVRAVYCARNEDDYITIDGKRNEDDYITIDGKDLLPHGFFAEELRENT